MVFIGNKKILLRITSKFIKNPSALELKLLIRNFSTVSLKSIGTVLTVKYFKKEDV